MIDGRTSDLIELFKNRTSTNIRKHLSNYALTNRQRVECIITDMNAKYSTPLRQMFPNAKIIIYCCHIIQLAMKSYPTYMNHYSTDH